MSAWIKIISDAEASTELKTKLEKVRAPNGTVDNVMRVHSLRPHTMIGHYSLYMSVLHNEGNVLPDWLLETIASYTSILNQCAYSLANHWANAAYLIGDESRSQAIHDALHADQPEDVFSGRELAIMRYVKRLTLQVADIQKSDVTALKEAGLNDGEILEINQVCCYFNYVNRQLNGLGVTLKNDKIGFYQE